MRPSILIHWVYINIEITPNEIKKKNDHYMGGNYLN